MALYERRHGKKALQTSKASQLLNISPHNLRQWVREGHLKEAFKQGNKLHFYREDLLAFKESDFYQEYLEQNRKGLTLVYICCTKQRDIDFYYYQVELLTDRKHWSNNICERELIRNYQEANLNSDSVVYLSNLIFNESPTRLIVPSTKSMGAQFIYQIFQNINLQVLDDSNFKLPD